MNLIRAFLALALTLNFCLSSLAAGETTPMQYVSVCDQKNVCRKFSRLIMGTDHLIQAAWSKDSQSALNETQVFAVLDEAARLGINFFDTSPIYVNGVENTLGKWIKSRSAQNPKQTLYTISKGGFPADLFYAKNIQAESASPELRSRLTQEGILISNAPITNGMTALQNVPPGTYSSRLYGSKDEITRKVSEEIGNSRNNLGDQITVYLMHRDDNDYLRFQPVPRKQTPVKTIMEALSAPELSEHYAMIGWSNWQPDRVSESLSVATANPKLPKPTFNSDYFSLFEMNPDRSIHAGGVQLTHAQMMDPNFQKGIFQDSYSPLGGFGILDREAPTWENAKKVAQQKFDSGDAYWQNVFHAIFTPENQSRYDRAVQFTDAFNRAHQSKYTVDQMVNAYALAHNRTDFLTIGPTSIEELQRTVAALGLAQKLSESDLDHLHGGSVSSTTGCTPHVLKNIL